jgi:hypothetical protein
MATITGFTSDRMLVIENESITNGVVQGDNLILSQRDGTQINAGNVRGPKGDTGSAGTPGAPGVIQSVNDQSSTAVYSPRKFTDLASISSQWAAAPIGSLAVTTTEKTLWEKDEIGWFSRNDVRVFASTTERDSRWVNPPNGSICQAPAGVEFRRISGAWQPWPIPKMLFSCSIPGTQSIPNGLVVTPLTLAWTSVINVNGAVMGANSVTLPRRAYYLIMVRAGWFLSGTTFNGNFQFITYLRANGTSFASALFYVSALTAGIQPAAVPIVGIYLRNAGDVLDLAAAQNHTSASYSWGAGGNPGIHIQELPITEGL